MFTSLTLQWPSGAGWMSVGEATSRRLARWERGRRVLLALAVLGGPILLGYLVIDQFIPAPEASVPAHGMTAGGHDVPGSPAAASQGRTAASAGAGAPGVRRITVTCLVVREDPDFCRRHALDLAERALVSDRQRSDLGPARRTLAADLAHWLPTPSPLVVCTSAAARSPAPCRNLRQQPAWTPAAVRAALVAAGFDHPQYRLARENDPAPHRTVLYGVRNGPACLVGYLPTVTDGAVSAPAIVGLLPSGTCLAS